MYLDLISPPASTQPEYFSLLSVALLLRADIHQALISLLLFSNTVQR